MNYYVKCNDPHLYIVCICASNLLITFKSTFVLMLFLEFHFFYISLLTIPCIMYYVTNKETLNLELHTVLPCFGPIIAVCFVVCVVFFPSIIGVYVLEKSYKM